MGKKNWYFLFFSVLFAACSSSETYFGPSQSSSNILRGLVFNSAGETNLPLPVSIYVFDSSDKCAGIQTLQTEDEVFSFTLPPGDYTLSVISGAAAEKYLLPDMNEAVPEFPLNLKSPGDTHAELAMKNERITVGNNDVKDLTIIVDRVISQISASINDVPDDVTSVSVSLQPLEEYLLLNGSYGGDGDGKATLTLEKESRGLWKTPVPVFVLPGADDVSVSITFTDIKGSHNYSYTTAIPLEANCKTEITATYKAGSAEIGGSIQCRNWKEEHLVSIEFGEGSSAENNGQNSNSEMLTQGDVYRTCYILDVLEESPEQSTLLLLSPQATSDATIENAATLLNKYNYEGFTNWKLLTVDEARTLYTICVQRLDELNGILKSPMSPDRKYLCMDTNQTSFYYFTIDAPNFELLEAQSGVKYSSRFVKEVTVEW
ncbi:MAG: FimB/Mfa2 family fimbrial subunit [Tannerellaceae bacterium]|jgi:hypothetical protein|nr:FimB/Mfa2 family fimbrial subunit [Tannerellaceae bacterium]